MAALLSLRLKCRQFLDVDEIEGVLQEGIGDETGLKGLPILMKEKSKSEPTKTSRKLNIQKLNAVKKTLTPPLETSAKSSAKSSSKTETAKTPTTAPRPVKRKKKEPQGPQFNTNDLDGVEPLVKSTKRWRLDRKRSPQDILMGRIKGILNKITFERFDILSESLILFIKAKIKTADQLKMVVSELFTKTVAEKHFGPLYADLCCQLQDLSFADPAFDSVVTFKVALVNQCQHEFENVFKPVELSGVSEEDRETKISQAKQRALGTVQFIGQLYMKDLLPDTICRVCLINLVSANPSDLQIENAYHLLLTIGKKYDSRDRGKHHLDSIFGALTSTSTGESSLKQRTKILVSIIKDVRKNNWVPPVKIEVAKTLEEIHQEFEAERGKVQISGRGQATFDEYIIEATSKYSKQLKFALSGGCAIRRQLGEDPVESSDVAPDLSMMDALLMTSSAIIDDTKVADLSKKNEDEEEVVVFAKSNVVLMSPQERAEIEGSFIRTFLSNRIDAEYTAPQAMDEFMTTIQKMGWPEKPKLVDTILNFTYDMAAEDAYPLGQALARLLKDGYVSTEEFMSALNEWCEFFTAVEMDAPKAVSYFADMMAPSLLGKHLSLQQVNEALQTDPQIDKWDLTKEAKREAKPFGRRPEFLGYVTRACKDLEYSVTDWGLQEDQTEAWRTRYPQ